MTQGGLSGGHAGSASGPPPDGRRRTGSARSKRRRPSFEVDALSERGLTRGQQRLLIAAGTVIAVLAGAFGLTALFSTLGVSDPPVEEGSAAEAIGLLSPSDYQAWPSLKLFAPIDRREADRTPLRAEEVFSIKTVRSGKLTLKLAARRLDGACAPAVWGGKLLAELGETGCTQVVRGLYVSADRRYLAQYTLFNMADTAAADRLVRELSTLYRGGGWVRPLESGAVVFPQDGYSEASGHVMGHYAGLVWVARADGQEATPRDDFVTLTLAARAAEKAVYRRVVTAGGPAASPAG
ncbi:hypothetical protein Sme01_32360 [Sphaerisporangium melleum]|uniref:Uncharacterized protein n=1 Tax=Sphaerisporangium melleum TaxID=321316 RepID=A0A917RJX4_9ACTN|nr:hypothetical protein [Sphaerisporangium melleum]GGL10255.1 hypothetical protein GCM10007964_60530 [Sphaerisporangium melleum]GII70760.1 hypothetical protein Sme01_32360 [Sphaerisporangium melleum]